MLENVLCLRKKLTGGICVEKCLEIFRKTLHHYEEQSCECIVVELVSLVQLHYT